VAYLLIGPDETLNYTFDWSDSLGEATIIGSTWLISPAGPTFQNTTYSDTTATCYVTGCEEGEVYRLTNRIETTAETTEERSLTLRGYAQ
jgi:hypothetical protein